jgi:signal peptidase I
LSISKEERTEILIYCPFIVFGLCFLVLILFYDMGIAQSSSMEPSIHEGDFLLSSKFFDSNHISEGSIINYYSPEMKITICHRILSVNSEGYVCKGDNNEAADPWLVKPNQVKGVIVLILPAGFLLKGIGVTCLLLVSAPVSIKVFHYLNKGKGVKPRHEIKPV